MGQSAVEVSIISVRGCSACSLFAIADIQAAA
jgi:hypothetical protein